MKKSTHIKTILFFLISFLLGTQNTSAKAKLNVVQNGVVKQANIEIYKNAQGVLGYRLIGVDDLVRGVSKSVFKSSFTASDEIAEQAWMFFKNEDWANLENLFNTHNLNGGWPPNNGFKNITLIETGSELSGKTFDRFQMNENIDPSISSEAWVMSNPPILMLAS